MLGLSRRVIISLPIHPVMLVFYMITVLPLILVAQIVVVKAFTLLGFSPAVGVMLSFTMFYLSLALSPVNIVLKEIGTKIYSVRYEAEYVYFYGIPVPVISKRLVENKILVTLNVGGALIPLAISLLMAYGVLVNEPAIIPRLLLALTTTSIIVYFVAKPIPGIGIAVPMFLPPTVAVTTTVLLLGTSPIILPASYISGTLGSLIGADILRLMTDKEKFVNMLGPSIVSIGGAGTFDGIYLSGLIALVLAFIFV